MLDVKRLKVLREVARTGSFSAAAEELGYTQPAISQQISALEREAGTRLLQRGARGVTLTDAGRSLVDHSDAILARLAAAEEELEAIAGLRGGRLRLASFPTAGATLVPLAIAMFSDRHPDVELSLIEAEPEDSLPALRGGELDVALTFEYSSLPTGASPPLGQDVELTHLLDDPHSAALPLDHPLSRRRATTARSAARWPRSPQARCIPRSGDGVLPDSAYPRRHGRGGRPDRGRPWTRSSSTPGPWSPPSSARRWTP